MSVFREKLNRKEFVISAEIEPEKSGDAAAVLDKIRGISHLIDAINVPDNPMAKMRMSPIVLCYLIQKEYNLDTIFHLSCRDRNVLGLQSEILGANALGVKNVLTLTGDSPTTGDHPNASGVFDMDSIGLANTVRALNNGYDSTGNELKEKTDILIGGVINPCADNIDLEIEKLHVKIEAGVNFIQTQPIFETEKLDYFLSRTKDINVPILYGLMPLKSTKFANYLNKYVPGVNVPEKYIKRLEEKEREAGLEIAKELFEYMKYAVNGVHIFPMGDVQFLKELLGE